MVRESEKSIDQTIPLVDDRLNQYLEVQLHRYRYFFLVSRKSGDSAKVKSTTSSPVTVLMS